MFISVKLVCFFKLGGLFHEDGSEFFQIELVILVDVVEFEQPLGFLK